MAVANPGIAIPHVARARKGIEICGLAKNLSKSSLPIISPSELYGELQMCSALQSVQMGTTSINWRRKESAVHALADRVASDFGEPRQECSIRSRNTEGKTETDDNVDFNWEEQWYPMYLTDEIPQDAPLALTVYDRQLVLYRDGQGKINCLEDRCPHRLAKLSEGQIIDGKIECLYHGWQFNGDGSCAKIPQLAPGAKIPKQACSRSYAVKDSQGVLWAWMGDSSKAPYEEIPYFDCYDREGFQVISSYCEFSYDVSVLIENVLDPAHVHISHDRTDQAAKREKAAAMVFEVQERSAQGFAGEWHSVQTPDIKNFTRFIGPSVVYNEKEVKTPDGKTIYGQACMLCRPIGQGRSAIVIRFGTAITGVKEPFPSYIPTWFFHLTGNTIFEQDMGFLASQNEALMRDPKPTKDLYLNMRSQDRWVEEYRLWLDKVGHGMPYYWGHRTLKLPAIPATQEEAPAGLNAKIASTYPSKGAFGHKYARDPSSRYIRHVVHCKSCRTALVTSEKYKVVSVVGAALSAAMAILVSKPAWRIALVAFALLMVAAFYACTRLSSSLTDNYVRPHRKTA